MSDSAAENIAPAAAVSSASDGDKEDAITALKAEKTSKSEETNGNAVNGSSNGSAKSSGASSAASDDDEDASGGENGNHVNGDVQAGMEEDSDVQMVSSNVTSSNPSPLPSTSKNTGDDVEEVDDDSAEDEEESDDEMDGEDEDDEMEEINDDDEVEEVKDSSSDSDIMEIDAEDSNGQPKKSDKTNVVTIDNMETLRSLANDAKRRQEASTDKGLNAASIISGKSNNSGVTITPTSSKPRSNLANSLPPGLTISQTNNKAHFSTSILNRNRSSSPATSSKPLTQQLNDPNLTDDTFVVEAPSFIVPYVYEKPPKETIKDFKKSVDEIVKKKEEEAKEEDGTEDTKKNEEEKKETSKAEDPKPKTYFESVLGKFIIDLGMNLVQEAVQVDLLKEQTRRSHRDKSASVMHAIMSLKKNIETSQETNKDFTFELKKCRCCSFRSESEVALEHHVEQPHITRMGMVRCNVCRYEHKAQAEVVNHMLMEHGVRGRVDRMPSLHQCPQCPYEDNMKGKLTRHKVGCDKRFRNERNQEPPHDWEPPAKIPKPAVVRGRAMPGSNYGSGFMSGGMKPGMNQFQNQQRKFGSMPQLQFGPRGQMMNKGRPGMNFMGKGSPSMMGQAKGLGGLNRMSNQVVLQALSQQGSQRSSLLSNLGSNSSVTIQSIGQRSNSKSSQPSISITPLPGRGGGAGARPQAGASPMAMKPGQPGGMNKGGFVICEICDGYIRDLEQLRNHMQWIHKVKIHPKMIYNRPPLNCQKCQFRFFTDQGLERHLLGSHGLVTASMQDLANKSQDSGRCPVCGKVYQWKLLNHVAKDHMKVLKPAHLSYKCTVCTATFGQYKLFENHVYTAHSGGSKKGLNRPNSNSSQSVKAPIKVSDEITIIPQKPSKSANTSASEPSGNKQNTGGASGPDVIELDDDEEEIDDEMKESNENSNTGEDKKSADSDEEGDDGGESDQSASKRSKLDSESSNAENGKQADSGDDGVEEIHDEEDDENDD